MAYFIPKFDFNDPLFWRRRYSYSQRFIGIPAAILWGSAIMGGTSLAGGLIGGKGRSPKQVSTFSWNQQQMDKLIFDLLMGIERDSQGREINRNPLINRLQQFKMPEYRKAPLTSAQTGALTMAKGMMPRIAGQYQPDPTYLAQLRQGMLPTDKGFVSNPRYMARGGTTSRPFVAGEAGPEVIIPSGPTTVIPNPEIYKKDNLGKALKKMAQASRKTGLPAKALGTVDPWRQYGQYYVPYKAPGTMGAYGTPGDFWDYTQPYAKEMQSEFEKYLTEQAGTTYAKDPLFQTWYKAFSHPKVAASFGYDPSAPDISKIGEREAGLAIRSGYSRALADWWKTMPEVTERAGLSELLATMPESERAGFGNWLQTTAGKPYGPDLGIQGQGWGLREGQWAFENPFDPTLNLTTLGKGIEQYLSGLGYAQGEEGAWAKPAATAPYDYSGLQGRLTPEQYQAFNEYLRTYGGGAMAGQGLNFNPLTGQYEFGNYYGGQWTPTAGQIGPGMGKAMESFLGQPVAAPETAPVPETAAPTPTPEEIPANIMSALAPILMGLAGREFDPTAYAEEFKKGAYEPAMKRFEEETRPAIRETFAGGNLFGSAREKAEIKSRQDLEESLAASEAQYVAQGRTDFYSRRENAINQAMQLAQLPSTITGQQASTDYKRAAAASMFTDMELQTAITDAKLTYMDIIALQTLLGIYGLEQEQLDAEFIADFQNALTGPYGMSYLDILNVTMNQYNEQAQIAYV